MREARAAFTLFADGDPLLVFHTGANASRREWEVKDGKGASLRFRTTMVDRFDELFGFMWLSLPRAKVRPGQPVRLKAVGESGGSPDWFMVFEDELAPSVAIVPEAASPLTASMWSQRVSMEPRVSGTRKPQRRS